MKELVGALARALVRVPEEVAVHEYEEDGDLVLELEVSPEDRGRVIGRGGRTAAALRTIVDAVAARQGRRCGLEILD
ncbi:MAG TPA: KH domain-containing protein [Vicinamibacteria bacterium]